MNTRTNPENLFAQPLVALAPRNGDGRSRKPLGQIMVELGLLSAGDMLKAAAMSVREDTEYGRILLSHGMATEDQLYQALAVQFECSHATFDDARPDVRLVDEIGADRCLRHGVVPWKRIGTAIVIATSRPSEFSDLRDTLPVGASRILMAVASETDIQAALLPLRQRSLIARAEARVTDSESCRNWNSGAMARLVIAAVLIVLAGVVTAPAITFLIISLWAITALVLNTGLKAAAALATMRMMRRGRSQFRTQRRGVMMRLPTVSIMVPLFKERAIAGSLVRRLGRLNYPAELLDICLVVENDDLITQTTLSTCELPTWMRQVSVPRGSLKTKPRALNYALDFCRGSIIGVYDAEDAPEPDQIYKVVRRFHDAPPKVACLQGILDFYNPRQNWLSRCFTIEYATWFRVILPGLERLKLAIPLGGTTLFFRREILEELGGWDAHNVTEDADLGIRLARHGYRTELIHTTTFEEANCRTWPWVKQRSRWLKGYAMTWAVHMQSPRRLWQDLGPRKFFGVQVLFGCTLSQFLLAPILWSFWALPLGMAHPLNATLTPAGLKALAVLFLAAEFVTLAVGIFAVIISRHRRFWLWVPTLHLYFPLAAIASYKAFWEMISRPFYWDKTAHGLTSTTAHNYPVPARRWIKQNLWRRRP